MRGTAIRLGGAAALVALGTLVDSGNGSVAAAGSTDTEIESWAESESESESGPVSGPVSGDSKPQMPTEAELEAFADCMRDHGVDTEVHTFEPHAGGQAAGQATGNDFFAFGAFGDTAAGSAVSGASIGGADASGSRFSIGMSATGDDPDALAAADLACRDLLGDLIAPPDGALVPLPKLTPDQEAELERDQRVFEECLSDHGVAPPQKPEPPTFEDTSSRSIAVPFEITVDDALTKALEECAPGSIVLDDGRATLSVGPADATLLVTPRD